MVYVMGMKRKATNIMDQLRQAMADSGQSLYAIAKGSGVDYASVQRFKTRERGLTLESAGKLIAYLGLELKPRKAGA